MITSAIQQTNTISKFKIKIHSTEDQKKHLMSSLVPQETDLSHMSVKII
jgi:hypothetical protein